MDKMNEVPGSSMPVLGDGTDLGVPPEQLFNQIVSLSKQLSTVAGSIEQTVEKSIVLRNLTPPPLSETLKHIIRFRRRREGFFPVDLLGEPAWDIVLDLMLARIERRKVSVSSLCIAAAVPTTTALRWIKLLVDRGMLVKTADRYDRRRSYIELSDDVFARIIVFFEKSPSPPGRLSSG